MTIALQSSVRLRCAFASAQTLGSLAPELRTNEVNVWKESNTDDSCYIFLSAIPKRNEWSECSVMSSERPNERSECLGRVERAQRTRQSPNGKANGDYNRSSANSVSVRTRGGAPPLRHASVPKFDRKLKPRIAKYNNLASI